MHDCEYLRAAFVKLFLYERQVDLSKTNAWNITINEKKNSKYTSCVSNSFKYIQCINIQMCTYRVLGDAESCIPGHINEGLDS